jgi:SAM-dependent methyltransferase
MQEYKYSGDYNDPLLAELYDQSEIYTDDVDLIRSLIGDSGPLNILECFSGTGRLLVPLAQDGHRITGIEIAPAMNARAATKIARLGIDIRDKVTLKVQDVLDGQWGTGYDLVIMGANAFYELPSAKMQERCIQFARQALVPGGQLFVDNDDYKGNWGKGPSGKERVIFQGKGTDGTFGRSTMEDLKFDEEQGILYMKRTWFIRTLDGIENCIEYICQKHPVSAKEVEGWLKKYDYQILQIFGDRQRNPYTEKSDRAIFWVKKR